MTMDRRAFIYGTLADKRERDPVIIPGEHGRADVASGAHYFRRFNPNAPMVVIHDAEGRERWLTETQAKVARAIGRLAGTRQRTTVRHIASLISVSPSTVSRTSVRLASFGLIAYQSNRGRYGGTIYVLRTAADGLSWFREEAKAKVRRWAEATRERFARLISNVAAYANEGVSIYPPSHRYKAATLKPEWGWEEIEEALR